MTLDLARIQDYYDEMAGDLQNAKHARVKRKTERKKSRKTNWQSWKAERAAKLQDAQSRYTMRIEMSLINALLVGQAKVVLPVAISNRTASIQRTLIWDPLLHRIEPLVCDVCGELGESLHLCTGGHLAHEKCLAPVCRLQTLLRPALRKPDQRMCGLPSPALQAQPAQMHNLWAIDL